MSDWAAFSRYWKAQIEKFGNNSTILFRNVIKFGNTGLIQKLPLWKNVWADFFCSRHSSVRCHLNMPTWEIAANFHYYCQEDKNLCNQIEDTTPWPWPLFWSLDYFSLLPKLLVRFANPPIPQPTYQTKHKIRCRQIWIFSLGNIFYAENLIKIRQCTVNFSFTGQ